jgi:hypothetical protein
MTERTHGAGEGGKGGGGLGHQAAIPFSIDRDREAWGRQPCGCLEETRPMDVRSGDEACACEDQRKRAQESVLEVFSQIQARPLSGSGALAPV